MEFVSPLFLVCVLAAAIPLILHLLAHIRVQEKRFPTLRFVKASIQKTARRRHLRNVLLLVLRMTLLALLAFALAEPLTKAGGAWTGRAEYAAAIILDNSMSMGARKGRGSRFTEARAQVQALLSGPSRPAAASLLATNGPTSSAELVTSLETVREQANRVALHAARAPLEAKLSEALTALKEQSRPLRAVYVFSDLQRISFDSLLALPGLSAHRDVHLFFLHPGTSRISNVGITGLEIAGPPVVDSELEFMATVANSAPRGRIARVGLRLNGQRASWTGSPVPLRLGPAGSKGSTASVRFRHTFKQPGNVLGEVALDLSEEPPAAGGDLAETDELALDNLRRFSLIIGERARALIAPGSTQPHEQLGPATMLGIALKPYVGKRRPWPITSRVVPAAAVTGRDMAWAQAAFFSDVPAFTPEQARAIEQFTRHGGTVVFFLGSNVNRDNYNRCFAPQGRLRSGLLPAKLLEAVGQIGPQAPALRVDYVDVAHPYFRDLFENREDYLTVIVRRYFRLGPTGGAGRVLMRLENGEPLMITRPFGRGHVVLCTTTASPTWTNLPITGLFLPAVVRMALLAPGAAAARASYLPGAAVPIRPRPAKGEDFPADAVIQISSPGGDPKKTITQLPIQRTKEGYAASFADTARTGVYRWRVVSPTAAGGPLAAGAFVVNPQGIESNLAALAPEELTDRLKQRGLTRVYVGRSVTEVHASAAADAKAHSWWDLVLAFVIFVLVIEVVVANRIGARDEQAPVGNAAAPGGVTARLRSAASRA